MRRRGDGLRRQERCGQDEKGDVLMRDGASEGDLGTGKTDGCGDCGMVDPECC